MLVLGNGARGLGFRGYLPGVSEPMLCNSISIDPAVMEMLCGGWCVVVVRCCLTTGCLSGA